MNANISIPLILLSITVILIAYRHQLIKAFIDFANKEPELINTDILKHDLDKNINAINIMRIKSTIKDIIRSARLFHLANDIILTSCWYSSFDKNVSLELKLYSADQFDYKLTHKNNHNHTIILHSDDGKCITNSIESDELPSVLLHLESILETIIEKSSKKSKLSIHAHYLVWFRSKSFALSAYPDLLDSFKPWDPSRKINTGFEGRFFLSDLTDLNDIIAKFPDADLIQIYDQANSCYNSFNIDDINKIFVF